MNLLESKRGRILLFACLYVSEGAPIGFIWWALPTLLRARGVAVEDITSFTALLVLPWALKFLWAPLVDSLRSPQHGFRSWIMGCQVMMGITLLPLAFAQPAGDLSLLKILLVVHALCASTQDVAIDALVINVAKSEERGLLNGCMQAGMLLGRSLFGGVALLIASLTGWSGIIFGLTACIWLSLVLLFFIQEPVTQMPASAQFGRHLGAALKERTTWWALAFALISAAAFEATGALAGPFLLDRQVPQETIGFFFALPAVAATLVGGIIGGNISDRLGRTTSVAVSLIGFVTIVAGLGAFDEIYSGAGPGASVIALLTTLYLFIGFFTVSSYALFMDLTDPKLGATQFSAFMAATNGCEAWSTWFGGRLVAWNGYAACFFIMSLISLSSLSLLGRLAERYRIIQRRS